MDSLPLRTEVCLRNSVLSWVNSSSMGLCMCPSMQPPRVPPSLTRLESSNICQSWAWLPTIKLVLQSSVAHLVEVKGIPVSLGRGPICAYLVKLRSGLEVAGVQTHRATPYTWPISINAANVAGALRTLGDGGEAADADAELLPPWWQEWKLRASLWTRQSQEAPTASQPRSLLSFDLT